MRHRDDNKKEAIIEATIHLVNEIGFASCSISKIAKRARVSPATIYVYFTNKEDLIVSTYVEIKKSMGVALTKDYDPSLPIRDRLWRFWTNTFTHISRYPQHFFYSEQFSNSPFTSLVKSEELDTYFDPLHSTVRSGIEQKIIKDVPHDVLAVFMFYPILLLANHKFCTTFESSDDQIRLAFDMAWDAIRL